MEMPLKRTAACSCGQLRLVCDGEPVRISMCHCLACQQRTGSVFGVQARFEDVKVAPQGKGAEYKRTADSGNQVTFHFCPLCGSTVWWQLAALPGFTVVAVGAFADPAFSGPTVSMYGARRHGWVVVPGHVEALD